MKQPEEEAFDGFVTGVWPRLFRTALALTGNRHDAEDLIQTACVKAYRSWKKVSRADNPEAYVHRIIVNQCVSSWRRRWRQVERSTETLPELAIASHDDAVSLSETIWATIQKLPPRQRAVVVLRYYEDLSEREIANVLNIAPGTVKSQASSGLKALRSALGAEGLTSVQTLGESA